MYSDAFNFKIPLEKLMKPMLSNIGVSRGIADVWQTYRKHQFYFQNPLFAIFNAKPTKTKIRVAGSRHKMPLADEKIFNKNI